MEHKIDRSIDIDALARQLAHGMSLEQMRERQLERDKKTGASGEKVPTVAVTPRGAAHLASIMAESAPQKPAVRDLSQQMSWEDARRKVWALFDLRAAHISQIENRDFEWSFDEDELKNVRNIIRYFINDPACEWPLTKGLFVYGMPGTGKTEVMQIFERFAQLNSLPKSFAFTSMAEVYVKAKSGKGFDPVTPNIQLDRCFDEFGLYTGAVMTFGESLDINEAIIEARYKRFRQGGQLSHFISNMTTAEVQAAFSPMIFDRIRSMCTSVNFKGKSKR